MTQLGPSQVGLVWDVGPSYQLGVNNMEVSNFDKNIQSINRGFSNFFKTFAKISFHYGFLPWKIEESRNSKNSSVKEYAANGSKFRNV